jgi:HK97 family phage prohead protease
VRTKHAATKFVFSEDADDTGAFEAVFATLNVKDRDGDVIVPGAIEAGKEVLVMAQHRWNDLPIGKARIYEEGDELIARGKFFVDTPQGAASYATAKNVGDLQEWSFGFNVLDAEPGMVDEQRVTILKQLDVFEVSPVMIGAGVNTRTLAVKEAIPYNEMPLADRDAEWNGPAEVARAESSESELRMMHAWVDPDGDPDAKSSYKLPHHTTSGEVVFRGVVAAMGALLGARGGVDIPDADRRGVYDHLAEHYADFDEEPPPYRDAASAACACASCGCNQVSNTAPVAGADESILRAVAQYEAIRAAMSGVQT